MVSSSAGSAFGNPLLSAAGMGCSSSSYVGSPQMPWPEHFIKPSSSNCQLPSLQANTGGQQQQQQGGAPDFRPVPKPLSADSLPGEEKLAFKSKYYEETSPTSAAKEAAAASAFNRQPGSPLLRPMADSPNLSVNTNPLPPSMSMLSLQLPSYSSQNSNDSHTESIDHTPSLFEPAPNGQDYLNSIAASFSKAGTLWGVSSPHMGSPSQHMGVGFPAPVSSRTSRSRSNTADTPDAPRAGSGYDVHLPPLTQRATTTGSDGQQMGVNPAGIWRAPPTVPGAVPDPRRLISIATSNNLRRAEQLQSEDISPPKPEPEPQPPQITVPARVLTPPVPVTPITTVSPTGTTPPGSESLAALYQPDRTRHASIASYVSSSPDSSLNNSSNPGAPGAFGSSPRGCSMPPAPPPGMASVWQRQYFTEDIAGVYSPSERSIEQSGRSPTVGAT
jgi:hypothetical protein